MFRYRCLGYIVVGALPLSYAVSNPKGVQEGLFFDSAPPLSLSEACNVSSYKVT